MAYFYHRTSTIRAMFFQFIQPCHPQRAKTVPAGDDWQHEIKFDGFRVQIHKLGDDVELYSRSGGRFSGRYPLLVDILRDLPAKSAIIDGEIVASDAELLAPIPALRKACPTPHLGVRSPRAQLQGSAQVVAGSSPATPAGTSEPVRLPGGAGLRELQ